jgi:hypothetical protein
MHGRDLNAVFFIMMFHREKDYEFGALANLALETDAAPSLLMME